MLITHSFIVLQLCTGFSCSLRHCSSVLLYNIHLQYTVLSLEPYRNNVHLFWLATCWKVSKMLLWKSTKTVTDLCNNKCDFLRLSCEPQHQTRQNVIMYRCMYVGMYLDDLYVIVVGSLDHNKVSKGLMQVLSNLQITLELKCYSKTEV